MGRGVGACAGPGFLGGLVAILLFASGSASYAQDREKELEGLREQIRDSRGRVIEHEADERALLERLEEVDRRLQQIEGNRRRARGDVSAARKRLQEIEPKLEAAVRELAATRRTLAARAVALYRGGELGPVRVVFAASSLPDLLTRAGALRRLVRHDADLVERHGAERDRLEVLRGEASRAMNEREVANADLARAVSQLRVERRDKAAILGRVREDRTAERRLLVELEQAAQALEEAIRSLGAKARRSGSGVPSSGFSAMRGALPPPVSAPIRDRFGRVVDPEFRTTTFRSGVDFAAEAGAPVRSVAAGVVRFAGWFRGYGRIVIVDHGDGYHTVSGHLDQIVVEVDNPVEQGQSLGTVGETGSLGGPSLYFELREGGDPLDPEPWLVDPRG